MWARNAGLRLNPREPEAALADKVRAALSRMWISSETQCVGWQSYNRQIPQNQYSANDAHPTDVGNYAVGR